MTAENKKDILKSTSNEELLNYFAHYAGKNLLEMNDSERETYNLVRAEMLERMSR